MPTIALQSQSFTFTVEPPVTVTGRHFGAGERTLAVSKAHIGHIPATDTTPARVDVELDGRRIHPDGIAGGTAHIHYQFPTLDIHSGDGVPGLVADVVACARQMVQL